MKKIIILTIAIMLVLPSLVLADGMHFVPYEEKISMPEQKAVIMWDQGEEILILSTKVEPEQITEVAWVIPIQSKTKPEVEEGDISLFFDLADVFNAYRGGMIPMFGDVAETTSKQGISILEVKTLDIYYIVTLQATDASVLIDWLNAHSFYVPQEAEGILEQYVGEDYYFIINRINLPNKLNEPLTEDDYACADSIYIHLWSEEALEYELEYAFEYINECKDASYDAVKLLKEVELGIETPLEITFEPDEPYYPMVISSLGEGVVAIDVYFLADMYMKDKSGQLESHGRREIPDDLKIEYNIDEDLVTYMKYVGKLEDITEDSFFAEYTLIDKIAEFIGSLFRNLLSK